MSPESPRDLRTRCVHSGEPHPRIDGAVAMPVFQSSTFESRPAAASSTAGEGAEAVDYHATRYLRLSNSPNHVSLSRKLADLEGTETALATASGMAAISAAVLSQVAAGDHVIAQDQLYGGTRELFALLPRRWGIEVSFVSLGDPSSWRDALRSSTRAFYAESISNPLLDVGELEAAARFADEHGLVSLVDNTFATPVHFRPIELGYDVVLHSATKYLNGHSDLVAGVVAGRAAHVDAARHLLDVLGGSLDPHACVLLQRGLKTLPLRVQAQCESAGALATFLAAHPAVERVRYPGLPGDPSRERASRWFSGFGAMIAFTPRGGLPAARRLLERLQLPLVAPSLGGVETLVCLPAETSHAGVPAETRRALGIDDTLVRISVGVEAPDDLIADFRRALDGADVEPRDSVGPRTPLQ